MKRRFKGIWIPAKLWESKEFTAQQKLMMAEIESLSNERGCFATNKYLASFFGLSERRIKEILAEMIAMGVVKSIRDGRRRVLVTCGNWTNKGDNPHYKRCENTPTDNKGDNKEDNKVDKMFVEFWDLYPKKVGKAAAAKIWTRKNLDAKYPEIKLALTAQKKQDQWCKENGKFIPHATTWLNQERWEDEVEACAEEWYKSPLTGNWEKR